MKKLLTLVVLLSAMTLTARAQGVHFGVKGGIDVTDMSFSEKVFNTSNRLGWFIGPSLQIEFPMSGFGVDIAGLYDQKSTEVNDQTIKTIDDLQNVVKEASTSKEPVLYIQGIYPTGKKGYFAVPLQNE